MESATDYVRPTVATLAPAIILVLYIAVTVFSPKARFWAEVPWVGKRKREWFAGTRANVRSIRSMLPMADEGYRRFSKLNKLFVVPNFAIGPVVVLPPGEVQNVLSKSDDVLNPKITQHQAIQSYYTIRDPRVLHKPFHFDIIRRQLTRTLGTLTSDIHEELGLCFHDVWGSDTENWVEVNLFETCMKIIARTANRVFVGVPLCRDTVFLDHSRAYSQNIFAGAAMINLTPKWSHPITGRLITWPNQRNLKACFRRSKPIIEERLRNTERKRNDPNFDWTPPNDYIQWHIEESYKRNDALERDPDIINARVMMVNMVAIHTSTITIFNTLVDLFSCPDTEEFVDGLREECDHILSTDDGVWTKSGLSKMLRIDSAVRESMRYTGIGLFSLSRIVSTPGGLNFGDSIHVPEGARIGIPMYSIHHDDKFYPNAQRYNAFRFSKPRELYEAEIAAMKTPDDDGAAEKKDLRKVLELKNQSMVTVGDTFLQFGHGKHACPGRFFASNEIKLMLAYVVQHYDIQHIDRPENTRLLEVCIPSRNVKVRVRRRKVSA